MTTRLAWGQKEAKRGGTGRENFMPTRQFENILRRGKRRW